MSGRLIIYLGSTLIKVTIHELLAPYVLRSHSHMTYYSYKNLRKSQVCLGITLMKGDFTQEFVKFLNVKLESEKN